jgi:ribonuclease HI
LGNLVLHSDGKCEPNPGIGTWGCYIYDDSDKSKWWAHFGKLAGKRTNNEAEYMGLIKGIEFIRRELAGYDFKYVLCKVDSELLAHQNMRVKTADGGEKWLAITKKPNLITLRQQLWIAIDNFLPGKGIQLLWIPREDNVQADALTNRAMVELGENETNLEAYNVHKERPETNNEQNSGDKLRHENGQTA